MHTLQLDPYVCNRLSPLDRLADDRRTRDYAARVIPLPRAAKERPDPFAKLTAALIIEQHRAGKLPEPILLALLAGVGLQP